MKIIKAVVEGQTEEKFIKEIINQYLRDFNIEIKPSTIITNRKYQESGGINSYDKLKNEINTIIKETRNTGITITTFLDFYQLPTNFPKYKDAQKLKSNIEKVYFLENAMCDDIGNEYFIPYIQIHEFEALLFSSNVGFEKYYNKRSRFIKSINDIISNNNPEEINDGIDTAPSKRLNNLFLKELNERYKKTYHGILIAKEINMDDYLSRCPHFCDWIERIKSV